MRRKLLLIFTMTLLLVSMASASTTINVKTVPFGEVSLNIREAGTIDVVERYNKVADKYGDCSFAYSGTLPYFDITYFIKKNDKKIVNGILENEDASEEINLELVPDGFEIIYAPEPEPEVEITLNETNETEEIVEEETIKAEESESESKKKLTAFSIFKREDGSTNWNFFYYFGGVIVLAGIVFFFLKTKKTPRKIKVTKLSELKKEQSNSLKEAKEEIEEYEKKMKELEEKIKDIKANLNKPKNADKISAIKKKMIEEEKELMKLRKEQNEEDEE